MREVIQNLLTSTSCRNRPQQIAAAVAVGVLCGLVPVSSVMCLILLACAFLLPIHLPLALVTALLVGLCSPWLQSALGEVGLRSLQHPNLSESWTTLDQYPLIPWLGLHNSVVNGGLLCGLALLLPCYLVARPLAMWVCQHEVSHGLVALADAPVLLPARTSTTPEPSSLDSATTSAMVAAIEHPNSASIDDLEQLLAECNSVNSSNRLPSDTQAIIERASRVAELVDDILANLEDELPQEIGNESLADHADSTSESRVLFQTLDSAGSLEGNGTPVSPTLQPLDFSSVDNKPHPAEQAAAAEPGVDERIATHTQAFESDGTAIQVVRGVANQTNEKAVSAMPVQSRHDLEDVSQHPSAGAERSETLTFVHATHVGSELMRDGEPQHIARREEALRYLLSHLRELREKV
jgi:uncharacterized protein (TIGR03546 family)